MSFDRFKQDKTLKIDFASNMQDIQAIIEYLGSHPEIIYLDLSGCSQLTDVEIQALANSKNLTQLQGLNLTHCNTTDDGIKDIAENLTQLQGLNLGHCYNTTDDGLKAIAENLTQLRGLNLTYCYNTTDDGIKAIAKNLTQLQHLNLEACANITNDGIKAIAKNLTQLQILSLKDCANTTDDGIKAIAEKLTQLRHLNLEDCDNITDDGLKAIDENLTQLQHLNLEFCNNLTVKSLVAIKDKYPNLKLISSYDDLLQELSEIERKKENKDFNLEAEVKTMIFNRAILDRGDKETEIQYILSNPAKYPFFINSVNGDGNRLDYFYADDPNMQKFLFEHGMVPKAEDQDKAMLKILSDKQSVHDSDITKKTNFITNELVESVNVAKSELEKKAQGYKDKLPRLFDEEGGQISPIEVKLLDLTSSDKRSVMEKTLSRGGVVPDDITFVKAVKEKAIAILESNYLSKNDSGDYNKGYPTDPMQYDSTEGAEKKITIPQSIGLIVDLIEKGNISRKDKQELCVTFLQQNPELVQEKLEGIRQIFNNPNLTLEELTNTTKTHESLNKLPDDQIGKLFLDTSGLNIEDIWKQQQEFKLAKQIYVAATTYGDNSTACIQGTWSQIIASAEEISPELLTKFTDHMEVIRREEAQKNNITKNNVQALVDKVLFQVSQDADISNNPELKETLADIAIGGVINIESSDEITLEQQTVLGKINQGFFKHIKGYLPNYTRTMPTLPEYKIFIDAMPNSPETIKLVTPIEQIQEKVTNSLIEYFKEQLEGKDIITSVHKTKMQKKVEEILSPLAPTGKETLAGVSGLMVREAAKIAGKKLDWQQTILSIKDMIKNYLPNIFSSSKEQKFTKIIREEQVIAKLKALRNNQFVHSTTDQGKLCNYNKKPSERLR